MRRVVSNVIRARTIVAGAIVASLISTTAFAIVAAEGMGTIEVDVVFYSPRDAEPARILGQLMTLAESGGAGYGGSYDPAGYGQQLINWVQNGYGYAVFDAGAMTERGARLTFTDVPVGSYRVMVWYDLNGNGRHDDGLEPVGFAETDALPNGEATVLVLDLGDTVYARAVVIEDAADATGFVLNTAGDPINGAMVTATQVAEGVTFSQSAMTDAFGFYSFDDNNVPPNGLPTGLWYDLEYSFVATLGELTSATETIAVGRASENVIPTLTLGTLPPTATFEFTAPFTAEPINNDADPLYDGVNVSVAYTVTGGSVFAILRASAAYDAGGFHSALSGQQLMPATYSGSGTLNFTIPGAPIRVQGIDPTAIIVGAFDYATDEILDGEIMLADLGQATDYQAPALTITEADAFPVDSDGDSKYDQVSVGVTSQAIEEIAAYFEAELQDGSNVNIVGSLTRTSTETLGVGTHGKTISLDASGVPVHGQPPRAFTVRAYTAGGQLLSQWSEVFEGGSIEDYSPVALSLDADDVTIIRSPESGLIETLTVRLSPSVAVAGNYRFTVSLLAEDYSFLSSVDAMVALTPTSGPVDIDFDGAEMSLILPGQSWTIARAYVSAMTEDYGYLAFVDKQITPGIAKTDLVRALLAFDLPEADSIDVEVLCGVTRIRCNATDAARTGLDADGWRELAIRMNVNVNQNGQYALSGYANSESSFPLASQWRSHEGFNGGLTYPVELVFPGRDIRRMGVEFGAGAVREIDVQALGEYYQLIDRLEQPVNIPATDFIDESLTISFGGASVTTGQDLRMPVTLNGPAFAGRHLYGYASLYTDDYYWVTYEFLDFVMPSGSHTVNVDFDGEHIRQFLDRMDRTSSSFRVAVSIMDASTWSGLAYRESDAFGPFPVSSFPAPRISIGAPGVTAVDTTDPANGLYDFLRLNVPLSVRPGITETIYTGFSVYGPNWEWIGGRWDSSPVDSSMVQVPTELTELRGRTISSAGVNGPYRVYFYAYDSSFNFLGYREVTSASYLASEFESGGIRIRDPPVADSPTPATAPYDGISVSVNIAVSPGAAGTLAGYVALYTQDWGWIGYQYRDSIPVDESTTQIDFTIPNQYIRQSGVNGVPKYYLYLWDTNGFNTIGYKYGDLTRAYNFQDFAITGLEFLPTSTWTDAATSDDLRITGRANVGTTGDYYFYAYVYGTDWSWVTFLSETKTFSTTGEQTFTIDIPAIDLQTSSATRYNVYVYAWKADYSSFAYTPSPYVTADYPPSTWTGVRPAEITSVAFGTIPAAPISEVPGSVGWRVNQPGRYTLSASLVANGVVVDSFDTVRTFTDSETGDQTQALAFVGTRIRDNWPEGFSGQIQIVATLYRGANSRAQILQESTAIDLGPYSRDSFPAPLRALTLGTASFAGAQTDEDTQFDVLRATIPVEIATAGSFRVDVELFGPSGRRYITGAEATATLAVGSQTVTVDLSGADIRSAARDGQYRVRITAFATDGDGALVRVDRASATTPSFTANEFN